MGLIYPEILWCGSNKRAGVDGWSFPRQVERTILAECEGMTFVHLFGGKSSFGVRLDVDPLVRPDVIGDAWLPPFAKNSFDCVVLDPPYIGEYRSMSNDRLRSLFRAAAWVARKRVIWFHTCWVESPARCVRGKTWLVRVGRHCQVRCLQFFEVPGEDRKLPPVGRFNSGPAMKYNRWLVPQQGFSFGESRSG